MHFVKSLESWKFSQTTKSEGKTRQNRHLIFVPVWRRAAFFSHNHQWIYLQLSNIHNLPPGTFGNNQSPFNFAVHIQIITNFTTLFPPSDKAIQWKIELVSILPYTYLKRVRIFIISFNILQQLPVEISHYVFNMVSIIFVVHGQPPYQAATAERTFWTFFVNRTEVKSKIRNRKQKFMGKLGRRWLGPCVDVHLL